MAVKKPPPQLYSLALHQVSKVLLQKWNKTFYTDYIHYSEEVKCLFTDHIPHTIYDQIFHYMIDCHARFIQSEMGDDSIPNVASLMDSLIVSKLGKLNLSCLRYIGRVKDEDIQYLENIILKELPNLNNLVEISLQTSGIDFTLPTCNDEMLDKIGSWCPNLNSLDVSYNHTVTDEGIRCLIPSETHRGCPSMRKITLFECSVTPEGISELLNGLDHLKFLGYRESGNALLHFDKYNSKLQMPKKLELAHVNNLGTISRTCKDINKLKCDEKMVNIVANTCPKLSGLKVRVSDADVKFLHSISSVSILELVYNLGTPMSPGTNTVQFLNVNGNQLVSLSFVCDTFTTRHLKVVCEQCSNLKRLWIRSNKFVCDYDLSLSDRKKCSLYSLEVFFLRVGWPESETCRIPHNLISYVLHKSNKLMEVSLAMKNPYMSDSYIQQLFSSILTSSIKHIMLLIPFKNVSLSSLSISMATVETLIGLCPQLEQLGNLLVWDVCLEEIQEMRRQLKLSNSALVLVYRMMYS